MNDQFTKDTLLLLNESELPEILVRDLLLSPELWDIVWKKTMKTDSEHYGAYCEMNESLLQYPTALDMSSTGNVLKSSPILQRWNGNLMSTLDPVSNNLDLTFLDD